MIPDHDNATEHSNSSRRVSPTPPPTSRLTYCSILGATLNLLSILYFSSVLLYDITSNERNDFGIISSSIHSCLLIGIAFTLSYIGEKHSSHKLAGQIYFANQWSAVIATIGIMLIFMLLP